MDAFELPLAEDILSRAEALARRAGELLQAGQAELTELHVRCKSASRDLVTDLDLASERLLVEGLREAWPEHAIEAEEETCDAVSAGELRWFIDPLDGTVNFVHGFQHYCVSMALYREGGGGRAPEPLLAVVHAPALGETFCARRGGGTFLNGEAVRVRPTAALDEAVVATGFPYRRGELEHSNLENFSRLFYSVRGLRRMGSAALDLANVAAGRLDAFWELHLSSFDVAAGALLVREAGGLVTDADGGEDWLRGGHLVAGGAQLHRTLVPLIEH
ncbi:MAG: inositol monophosphatase family protein [Planctomycetota bacterium]|nr:inositol monophosphatase family protein [Planctomycetota bacterium]